MLSADAFSYLVKSVFLWFT